MRELALIFQEAEERAAEREERAAEREARMRERELEMEAKMREREDRREERMITLFSSAMQRMAHFSPPPHSPNQSTYHQSFPNPPFPSSNPNFFSQPPSDDFSYRHSSSP